MSNHDRHISISSGWIAAGGLGLISMTGPQYLNMNPLATAIGFWLGVTLFGFTIFHLLWVAWNERGKHIVSGPYILMALAVVLFLSGLAWQTWPKQSPHAADISSDEKLRRKFLLDDARSAYLSQNQSANPLVSVGLEDIPYEFANTYLLSKGEKWKLSKEDPILIEGDGLFISCNSVVGPVDYRAGEQIFTLNLWPNVGEQKISGGLGITASPKSGSTDFGSKGFSSVLKCTISNYTPAVLRNVVIGANAAYQELVPDAATPTTKRGGRLLVRYPTRIDIEKLDTGENRQFVFYIPNPSSDALHIQFFDTATAKHIGGESLYKLGVSTNSSIPFIIFPSNI